MEHTQVQIHACSVLAQKVAPTQFGWSQQMKQFALSCTFPVGTPVERIKEAVINAVREGQKLDEGWQLDVVLSEIPMTKPEIVERLLQVEQAYAELSEQQAHLQFAWAEREQHMEASRSKRSGRSLPNVE